MKQSITIWARFLLDDEGKVAVGGVEAYAMALAQSIAQSGCEVKLVTPFEGQVSEKSDLIQVVSLADWQKGKLSGKFDKSSLHIYTDIHNPPDFIFEKSIGIQHGILWDKPVERVKRLPGFLKPAVNFWRNYSRVRAADKFKHVVCVDLAFPNNVACINGGIDWQRFHYIPNFAPANGVKPEFAGDVSRIVFSRRFVEHRGTLMFIQVARRILTSGWQGEVHFVGGGPLMPQVKALESEFPQQVKVYRLPFERRLEAFDEKSICVVPSLSTEGTSLSCIEGWSKGALVISSGVGGLGNLLQDEVNGVLCAPTASEFYQRINEVLTGHVDVARLRQTGWNTFQQGFTQYIWGQRWLRLINSITTSE